MYALIEKSEKDRLVYWTGDEWVSTATIGWRDAARFEDHRQASLELEHHEDDPEFSDAKVIDVD
jgi:hypothetical protein